MNPSEYAYHDDSFAEAESTSTNCRRYPSGLHKNVGTDS